MEGGLEQRYLDAKWKAGQAVFTAKRNAQKKNFASVKDNKENIFYAHKQMHTENQDVIGQKCMGGDDDNFSLDTHQRSWHENNIMNDC